MILNTKMTDEFLPDFEDLKENFEIIHKLVMNKKVLAVSVVKPGGISETITKMCMGNKIGFEFTNNDIELFSPMYGSFIIELKEEVNEPKLVNLGNTTSQKQIVVKGNTLDLEELIEIWQAPLEKVFPTKAESAFTEIENVLDVGASIARPNIVAHTKFAKPRVYIPTFPGTNCEYDSAKAFEDAGGIISSTVFKNLKPENIEESIEKIAEEIKKAQIIMIPRRI